MALTTVNRVVKDPIVRKTPGAVIRLYVADTIKVDKTIIISILNDLGLGPKVKKEFSGGYHKVTLQGGGTFFTDDAGLALLTA